jgi:hypothetical protein
MYAVSAQYFRILDFSTKWTAIAVAPFISVLKDEAFWRVSVNLLPTT